MHGSNAGTEIAAETAATMASTPTGELILFLFSFSFLDNNHLLIRGCFVSLSLKSHLCKWDFI